MACEARAARGSLIYILEMISLRIEPRNFEDYLYISISFISFHINHFFIYIVFSWYFFIIVVQFEMRKGEI